MTKIRKLNGSSKIPTISPTPKRGGAYTAAKAAFEAYCGAEHLALVTPNQTTYHATEKSMCEQLFKEYRIEYERNPQTR